MIFFTILMGSPWKLLSTMSLSRLQPSTLNPIKGDKQMDIYLKNHANMKPIDAADCEMVQ